MSTARAATTTVHVFGFDFSVNPKGQPIVDPVIDVGDTIHWVWDTGGHNVKSVARSVETFDTPIRNAGFTFDHTFTKAARTVYYCVPHATDLGDGTAVGMWGAITASYPGDVNLDFKVDLTDFGVLKDHFGLVVSGRAEGDANGDSTVNIADFALLKANFGKSAGTTVPEPSAWLLAALAAIGCAAFRGRRHS
jgi:hypothetical protein